MFRFLKIFLTPCLLLLFVCLPIPAQTVNATLSGVVEDEKGAVIPGVKVTITNPATGFESSVITNSAGAYVIPLLPPASYTVTAEQTGFTRVQFPNIVLNVNDVRSLRIELKVGSVEAAIEVRPDETLVNTSPAVATTIDRTFVGNLPLNARSFQSLILLTPGVVLTPSTGNNFGQFSVNGQRTNANYFTVDGVSANSSITATGGPTGVRATSQQLSGSLPSQTALGTTQSILSIDALEEFKIQTSTYSAEFGRQPGAQVQFTSRSGTNAFHGSAFDYVRNEAFDANNWFSNARPLTAAQRASGLTKAPHPALRQHQFGGTIGGPIYLPNFGDGGAGWYSGKDRTFFFISYEGLRALQPVTGQTFVPSIRLRESAAPSIRPILNAIPIPTEPEMIVNGQPSGMARFFETGSSPIEIDGLSIRVDHAFNGKFTIFGRFGDTPSESLARSLSFLYGNKNEKRDITLGSTQIFRSNLNNEIRFNYTTSRGRSTKGMDDFGGATLIDPSLLVSGYTGTGVTWGSLNFFFSQVNYSMQLGDDSDSYQEQFNLVDNFSWTIGDHRLKFGFDYRRLAPTYGPIEYQQETTFGSLQALQTAVATDVFIRASQGSRPRFNNYSLYVDDTWSATKKLTLSLGLRWEINPPAYDANGLKPALVCGAENLLTASLCPSDTPIRKTHYTAFAPRIGAAYLLNRAAGRETVIRGGIGIFYDLGNSVDATVFSGYPFSSSVLRSDVPFPLSAEYARPPAFPAVELPLLVGVSAVNDNLKLPVTYQWNFGVEQSFGANQTLSVFYVASAGRRLLSSRSLNERYRNPVTGVRGPRPNTNFAGISYTSNGPTSDYHSMQVRYQRRLSRGLQALANYTWAHAIDEVSDEFTNTLDRGNAAFDLRHNFSAGLTYDIPKAPVGSLAGFLLRDWSVDALVFLQSGLPINVVEGGATVLEDGRQVFVRPDLVPDMPFWVDDPDAPSGRKLNFHAFSRVPRIGSTPARQGNLARNAVPGPGVYQANVALRRQFSFSERWKLQLKAEVFNVFNRPHFGDYLNRIEGFEFPEEVFGKAQSMLSSSLGGVTALYQIGGPRSMQFSARISF